MKAIETSYKGYRFRSRIEARWAVFLDSLGIPYEYEKEGYDLDGELYLPDFWIPSWKAFMEIKGDVPSEEEKHKCQLLANASGKKVLLTYGNSAPSEHSIILFEPEEWRNELSHTEDEVSEFRQCRRCPEIFLVWKDERGSEYAGASLGHPKVEEYERLNPTHECLDRHPLIHAEIEAAFNAARSARFEHGEKGGI